MVESRSFLHIKYGEGQFKHKVSVAVADLLSLASRQICFELTAACCCVASSSYRLDLGPRLRTQKS